MREILFRGKNNEGNWREGSLVAIRKDTVGISSLSSHRIERVDRNTVGQYTGLTDKNGKKIFEGDILNTSNSNCRIWYVDYKNTAFCCNQGSANYSCVLDEFMQCSSVEVIGNIHDNPELLGGEQE